VKTTVIDQTAGVVMPFWSDNNILFLAGKGDGNIRFYEYENDALHLLSEHKSSDPQRGMCFLPRRSLSVGDCEIARAFKIHGSAIEPIAFIVPRKADSFQSDIFPPAPSAEPSMSASEYFSGKEMKKKLVDLQTGATSASASSPANFAAPPPQTSTPTSAAPAPSPVPAPAVPAVSKSFSAPSPATPVSAPAPASASEPMAISEPSYSAPTPAAAPSKDSSAELQSLRSENARLNEELREARNLIRDLELKAESSAANAKKAAQMLSEFQ
jgi:coronin-1B/1C/6